MKKLGHVKIRLYSTCNLGTLNLKWLVFGMTSSPSKSSRSQFLENMCPRGKWAQTIVSSPSRRIQARKKCLCQVMPFSHHSPASTHHPFQRFHSKCVKLLWNNHTQPLCISSRPSTSQILSAYLPLVFIRSQSLVSM